VFGSIALDYKAALNALGMVTFISLFAMTTRRRGDAASGMTVDDAVAHAARRPA